MGKTRQTRPDVAEVTPPAPPAEADSVLSIPARILIFSIRIYQFTLSPLIGNACRHQPTCSNYGLQAIRKYGAIKGGWLTTKRVCRCHPWGTRGYDPVD